MATEDSPDFVPPAERIATFDKTLDEAPQHGRLVVDMKDDWRVIYTAENR